METQQDFAAAHYAPRAGDYVTSAVHAAGPDLDQMERLLRDLKPARVLDLGCGGGHVSYRAALHAKEVVACDPTKAMLEMVAAEAAKRGLGNIETLAAAAEQLPFADASFDAVLCRFTAHHWADLGAGLREACRVLKPGGAAVFIDSIAPEDAVLDSHLQAIELLRDPSHVRNYRVSEWQARLGEAGFKLRNLVVRRVPILFEGWVARTRMPPATEAVLRSLIQAAPAGVRKHLAVAANCDWELESMTCELVKA